jgi:serine/threonine protein kinase
MGVRQTHRGLQRSLSRLLQFGNAGAYQKKLPRSKPVHECLICHIAISIGQAFAYFYTHYVNYSIAHQDIRPKDILRQISDNMYEALAVKQSNFGMARQL